MKRGVEIIECLLANDPGSEGHGLKHLFDLMQVESRYKRIHSIDELLDRIASSEFRYAHVTTHGAVNEERDQFQGWWTHTGHGSKKELRKYKGRFKQTAIISTACKSGSASFGKFIVNEAGSKYFIGPKKSPYFHNSFLFSHIFYHKLFATKKSTPAAFNSYAESYKNPHSFRLFVRGE